MLTTLKDLCSTFPKTSIHQSPLDNVAATVFDTSTEYRYIHSVYPPEERYGIHVNQSLVQNHHNYIVPNFINYGPNEQYLINKILYSPCNLIYIIGGIGVGKTRFTHFLINEVLPGIIEQNGSLQKNGPCSIYYDFLEDGNVLPVPDDSSSIRAAFLDSFCDRIEAELYAHNFFDLDDEVGLIWDELLEEYKNDHKKHVALSFIISQLRNDGAERKELVENYSLAIEKRKNIRQKIISDQGRRVSYLALLLKYARQKFFNSNPAGLLLIIDNVDRESSLVQQEVKRVIKPFARVSGARTVVNARQTTFYQQFNDDGSSDPVDVIPYCGASPYEILKERIDDFLADNKSYQDFYNPNILPYLIDGIKYIRENLIITESFKNLFSNLCGRSVRKGLILGQNLINNSVYDPSKIHDHHPNPQDGINVKIGDVLRALLVGTDAIFRTSPNHVTDNIFEVGSYPGNSYLLKLRILKLIYCSGDLGVNIKRLISNMCGFGFSLEMICSAVNELKNENKRLLWSDAVRMNFKEEDFVNYGPTHLFLSSSGMSYIESLFTNIDYIQEVMLDTRVEASSFGQGWRYDVLEDRFELILKFLTMLSLFDQEEVELFIAENGEEEYYSCFGSKDLITKIMFCKVKDRVDKILSSVVKNQKRGSRKDWLRDFRARHLGIYEDRIITLKNFEDQIFR